MVHPYAWTELKRTDASLRISARSGHTLVHVGESYICFGGSDGRKDLQGKTCPNNDLFVLSLQDGKLPLIISIQSSFTSHIHLVPDGY